MIVNKTAIVASCETISLALTDTAALDIESERLHGEIEVVREMIRKCVEENAYSALDQGEYQQKYKTYVERYDVVKDRLTEIDEQRFEHITKREHITRFLKLLKQSS